MRSRRFSAFLANRTCRASAAPRFPDHLNNIISNAKTHFQGYPNFCFFAAGVLPYLLHHQLLLLHFLLLILLLLLLLGEEEGVWGRGRGWNTMFHALDLAAKILHFALLSALQNKPFRSAIADVVFRRLFRIMFKRLSLRYSRKVAKTELYQRELFKNRRDERKERSRKNYEKGKARVWVFVELYEKQLNSAAGSLNVCEAPLCGCMSKHFTRSFVAQRFRAHFTFLPWQKHFTFARKIYSHLALFYPRKNFTSVAARHAIAY